MRVGYAHILGRHGTDEQILEEIDSRAVRPALYAVWVSPSSQGEVRDAFPLALARELHARGIRLVIFLEWCLTHDDWDAYGYEAHARGELDPWMREFVRDVDTFGHTVLVRPDQEPQGNFGASWQVLGDSVGYHAMFQRTHRVMSGPLIRLVFCPSRQVRKIMDRSWRVFFPGRRAVDVMGFDAYDRKGGLVRDPDRMVRHCVDLATKLHPHAPLMVCEIGVQGGTPESRATWIRRLRRLERDVDMLLYFDVNVEQDGDDWSTAAGSLERAALDQLMAGR